mmetsp:Transcript_13890/g.29071  ORF Transcript_13890/g.29071 Transcript_13890/m.29071 type:complete len:200 (-) Transcript_13890:713-1312(-)
MAHTRDDVSPCHPSAQEVEAFKRRKLLKAWADSKSSEVTGHPRRPKIIVTAALEAEDRNQIARGQGLQQKLRCLCARALSKLQALQPTLVFVLLSHHNGLQYQVEPFFRQTSLIYAHLAPETDFELATLPRGPPIFRFGFQKKILVCSKTEASPVRLTVTVTPAKPKSFSGKDHLARVLSLVSRATAGPGSKLVIRWML